MTSPATRHRQGGALSRILAPLAGAGTLAWVVWGAVAPTVHAITATLAR